MKLHELIYDNEYISNKSIDEIEIENITTSKSEINKNTLFVLNKSINFDIKKIINYIINQKPTAILCDMDVEIPTEEIIVLKTENTRKLFPHILVRFYNIDLNSMRFIGITGTAGKTTTATMIHHILTFSGLNCAFIGTGKIIIDGKTINDESYSMTTPDPQYLYQLLKKIQDMKCDAVIMEVSSHALYFHKVDPIIFDISVFTNLSPEHMDFHKNIEDYYKTKIKLFSQSKLGIFNMDDPYSRKAFYSVECKKKNVGIVYSAESVAKNISMKGFSGSEYILSEPNKLFKIKLNLGGAFNIYNSLLAIKVACEYGIKPCISKMAISTLNTVEGRLEIIHKAPTIIIDYAHTINEMENVLKFIKTTKNAEQNLITVFGCGGERDKSKRPMMARTAEKYSDYVIVTADNSRNESGTEIIKDILRGFNDTSKRRVITSRKAAIKHAILTARSNDIIALIGKGHERYNIDKNGYKEFNEKAIVLSIIKDREEIKR